MNRCYLAKHVQAAQPRKSHSLPIPTPVKMSVATFKLVFARKRNNIRRVLVVGSTPSFV